MAGAKIEGVVSVHTVGDDNKTARVRQFIQRGKQFVFAEIATIGGVSAVRRILHLVRFDEFVLQAELAHKLLDYGPIMGGVTRRERRNGQSPGTQRFVGGPGQIGGVSAARERDNQRRNLREASEKMIFFLFRRQYVALGSTDLNWLFHLPADYFSACHASCQKPYILATL